MRGLLVTAALAALLPYAAVLGRPEVRIVRPNKYTVAAATRTGYPFNLVDIPGQYPYLSEPV